MSDVDSCKATVIASGAVDEVSTCSNAESRCIQQEEGTPNRVKTNNTGSISRRLKKGRVAELSSRFDCPPDRVVVRVRRNRIEEVKVCRAPSAARSFRNASKMQNDSGKVSGDAKRKPSFKRATPGKVREAVRRLENIRSQSVQEPSATVRVVENVEKEEVTPLEVKELKLTTKYGKLYEKFRLRPTAKGAKKPMTLPKPDLKTVEEATQRNSKLFLNEPITQKILQAKKCNDIVLRNSTSNLAQNISDDKNEPSVMVTRRSLETAEANTTGDSKTKTSPRVPPKPNINQSVPMDNDKPIKEIVEHKIESALHVTDQNKEVIVNNVKSEISDEERLYQEVKLRIKPNQSFLFRSISQTETSEIYMNITEILEQEDVNKSANISDNNDELYSNSCDIIIKTESDSKSINNSTLSVDSSYDSCDTLVNPESVVLRKDKKVEKESNEYDECGNGATVPNNKQNGSVYGGKHLYQRLSDCSTYARHYDHLSFEEDDGYEICNEPLPPRNGILTNGTHSDSSRSSDEKVCSLYEMIPPATADAGDNATENLYDVVRGGREDEECYESIRGDSPIPPPILNASSVYMPPPRGGKPSPNATAKAPAPPPERVSPSMCSDRQNSLYAVGGLNDLDSDGWEDISENEEDIQRTEHNVVIIRERARCHRSPSWSRKVRRQRSKKGVRKRRIFVSSLSAHYISWQDGNSKPSGLGPPTSENEQHCYENTAITPIQPVQTVAPETFSNLTNLRLMTGLDQQGLECQEIILLLLDEESKSSHHYDSLGKVEVKTREVSPPLPLQVEANHTIPLDYESDSFDSDSDSDGSSNIRIHNDSGVDMDNCRLPEPPPNSAQSYSLSRFANAASRKMKKLRRNWSLTKNDISKSLSRIKKTPPKSNSEITSNGSQYNIEIISQPPRTPTPLDNGRLSSSDFLHLYSNTSQNGEHYSNGDKRDSLSRRKYWSFKSKFRRSTSVIVDNGSNGVPEYGLQSSKSTFYLTDSVDVDSGFSTGSERFVNSEPKSSAPELPPPHIKRRSRPMSSPEAEHNSTSGRRSACGIRPLSPPPPPPNTTNKEAKLTSSKRSDRNGRGTSWYAECGLFKPEPHKGEISRDRDRSSTTSWYAEVGLYQTSAASTASSSGMSTAPDSGSDSGHYMNVRKKSTSANDVKIDDQDILQHRFEDEPLYQFYNASKLQSVCSSLSSDSEDTDGYEEVGPLQELQYSTGSNKDFNNLPETAEPVTDVPKTLTLKLTGTTRVPSRTLWCEIPEVVASNILGTLTPHQRRLQEAKFELVSSEASYLNSLNLLRSHFMAHAAFHDKQILSVEEWQILFGNVDPVYNCSSSLLADLELCWQKNILLPDICETVRQHAEKGFQVYVKYCEQQPYLDRTLKKLKDQRGRFYEQLTTLESSSACQGLGLHSFLMLPMQRITRFPLLIDAVLKRLDQDDEEYPTCQSALSMLNQIVHQCNEAARHTEHMAELSRLSRLLEYPQYMTPVPLLPRNIPRRVLVRSGELTHIACRGDDGGPVTSNKLTFGKKLIKTVLNFFLFTDVMIIAKKKSDENYLVVGHCPRSLITVLANGPEGSHVWPGKEAPAKFMLLLTILENHEGKTVEMFLSCASESDRQRWLEAWSPPSSDNPDEVLYEDWDCPQLIARHQYIPRQPDELGLEPGDVVNVNRKMADGWYHGERIRDGDKGWFPGNYTEEIGSPHLRARYLKQRYRLMAYNANFELRRKR